MVNGINQVHFFQCKYLFVCHDKVASELFLSFLCVQSGSECL